MLKHLGYGIHDDFEFHGQWWLPEKQDNKVCGTLRYGVDNGIRLDLIGAFRPGLPNNELFKADIIQGITVDGIECTLLDNEAISESMSFPGFFTQGFRSTFLILGCWFDQPDDLFFESYKVNFEYLEEWLDRNPYKFDVDYGEAKFAYHLHWPSRLYLKEKLPGINGEITISDTLYTSETTSKTVRIDHDVFLKFKPDEPQSFETYRNLFFDLQHFLTLLLGESTYPRKIQAIVEVESDQEKKNMPIGIVYNMPSNLSASRLYQNQMLVPFSMVSDELPRYMATWFDNSDKLRPVYNLFFSYLYKPDMYLDNRFLNLVRALESYHRIMIGGIYESQEEYDLHYNAIIGAIPDDVSDELRKSIMGKLKFGNEYTLARRLKDLFTGIDERLSSLVTDRVDSFIWKIVNTRNYITHYNIGLKTAALLGIEIFYACQRLRILLTILLLQSIGLSDEVIVEQVFKNRRIQPWD